MAKQTIAVMITRFYASARHYFLNTLQTQLIITIVAMPILIAWGMGTSLMTFVGNIVFTPFLMIFLMLSSLVFFTELLGIPNGTLTQLLEHLTTAWHQVLSCGQTSWLFFCANPGALPLACITLGILIFIHVKRRWSVEKKIVVMSGIVLAMGASLWLFSYYRQQTARGTVTVFQRTGSFTTERSLTLIFTDNKPLQKPLISFDPSSLLRAGFFSRRAFSSELCRRIRMSGLKTFTNTNQTARGEPVEPFERKLLEKSSGCYIVDHGFFAQKKSAGHTILFELKPYLASTFGRVDIDTLIITKPSLGSFDAATALCAYCGVKRLYVAYTKNTLSKHAWKVFYDLARFAQAHDIALERIPLTPEQLRELDAKALVKTCCALPEK